jgi:integrase
MAVREDKQRPGTYVAQLTAKTVDGLSHRVSARASTPEEALRVAKAKARAIGRQVGKARRITMQVLVDEYVAEARATKRQHTADEYERVLLRSIDGFETVSAARVDAGLISKMMRRGGRVWTSGKNRELVESVHAIKRSHAMLFRLFTWAQERDVLVDNPASRVKPPRPPKKEKVYWTPEMRREFIAACTSTTYGPLLTSLMLLGLRAGEAQALHKDDVMADRVLVRRSWDRTEEREVPPKAGSARTLPMPGGLFEMLEASWKEHPPGTRLAFPSQNGSVLDYHNIARYLARVLDSLPHLPRVTLHDLRKLAATSWAESGLVRVKDVQAMLGHTTSHLAHEIYVVGAPVERTVSPVDAHELVGVVAPWLQNED